LYIHHNPSIISYNLPNLTRPLYLDRIKPFIGKSLIKVLVGQRRVGKSYLLRQILQEIQTTSPQTNCIYINKESLDFTFIKTAEDLHTYVTSKLVESQKTALFIDEVQDIDSFESVLRDYCARDSFDIYISGSNANLLSSELATFLSGRYIEFKIYGLSYPEYLQFHVLEDSVRSFQSYLKNGGLPYLIHLNKDAEVISEYHKNMYNTIILKDVVTRYNVRNVAFLESLNQFLASNIGSIVSAKKISEYLKSQKVTISTQSVLDYLSYLESALFILKVQRTELQGKKIFEIGEKYYFEDLGIRNALVGFSLNDIHKLLENVVYTHLKMANYTVWIGIDGKKEIDFIAEKNGERIYIQVAYLLQDEKTIEREFGNLLAIQDNYPKFVITMDDLEEPNSYKGIHRMHAKDFCAQLVEGRLF